MKTAVDRSSPLPYYVQVKQALVDEIQSGRWQPGHQLPIEADLCAMFGVSRTVVRQALQEMVFEGLIERQKGRGTFVSEPKIRSTSLVHSLTGFHQDLAERGLKPYSQVLEQTMRPAEPKVAAYLKVEPMTPVVRLKRLRFVNDEPIVLVTSYLPYDRCRDLVNAELANQSLYAFLQERYGYTIARGRRRIEAVPANEEEARRLQVSVGAPMIMMESVSYLTDGTPIEYFKALFRGDRSQFEVEIPSPAGSPAAGADSVREEEDWLKL